jgi:Raf kinase inhibitor-like YbhB/YbcL family protein
LKTILICALFPLMAVAQEKTPQQHPARKPGLYLTSPAFEDGAIIPTQYTGSSATLPISPELKWTNVPDGTVSFVLILDDQDNSLQRTTNMTLHWLMFNIPGTSRGLPEDVPHLEHLPDGSIQAKLTATKAIPARPGYKGMGAPAEGPYHHYVYWLFALDTRLPLDPSASRDDVYSAINGHILDKAVLVGRFHR